RRGHPTGAGRRAARAWWARRGFPTRVDARGISGPLARATTPAAGEEGSGRELEEALLGQRTRHSRRNVLEGVRPPRQPRFRHRAARRERREGAASPGSPRRALWWSLASLCCISV